MARGVLRRGRVGVFEIDDDLVGTAGRRLVETLRPIAGDEQQRPRGRDVNWHGLRLLHGTRAADQLRVNGLVERHRPNCQRQHRRWGGGFNR